MSQLWKAFRQQRSPTNHYLGIEEGVGYIVKNGYLSDLMGLRAWLEQESVEQVLLAKAKHCIYGRLQTERSGAVGKNSELCMLRLIVSLLTACIGR